MNYKKAKNRALRHALKVKQKREIYKVRHKYDDKPKLTTTKLVMIYLFCILNVILGYSMWAMIYMQDISALSVLITDIAGQVLVCICYFKKSASENTAGGIVFETALQKIDEGDDVDAAG